MYFEFGDSNKNITDLVCLDDIVHVDVSYISTDKYNIKLVYAYGVVVNIMTPQAQKNNFLRTLVFYKNNGHIN